MRCYFLSDGHITGVELLDPAEGDDGSIKHAHAKFEAREKRDDGFEVWDRSRFIYRFPEDLKRPQGRLPEQDAPAGG